MLVAGVASPIGVVVSIYSSCRPRRPQPQARRWAAGRLLSTLCRERNDERLLARAGTPQAMTSGAIAQNLGHDPS